MLTSQLGIRLIIWAGATVPLPAPPEVLSALTRLEVTNDARDGDGFQITFTLAKETTEFTLVQSGVMETMNRVIIGVLMGVMPEVLIDGIITNHELTPGNEPGSSTLTVTGRDVSIMMDLEEKNESFPNQPDFLIATQLIAAYAQYGLIPTATPTTDVPIMLDRIPRQQETDFRFIQRLAVRNGYVFYVEPLTFGVNTAYWGPEIRAGLPQSGLAVNLGDATNVKSLRFSNNALGPVATKGTIVEPISKSTIPIPPLPSLRVPPLSTSPVTARRTVLLRETANRNPSSAAVAAVSSATNAPDAVTGEGELDSVRYGRVLRARRIVGVRGAGLSYDGLYYVRKVTHSLAIGSYTQRFTLSREGTGTITPVVVP